MTFETINTFGDADAAEGFRPGNRASLVARFYRQSVRRLYPPADDAIDCFFGIGERCFHAFGRISRETGRGNDYPRPPVPPESRFSLCAIR